MGETSGCVEHIKCIGSISRPLCGNHKGPKEYDGHHLNSWSSGSSAIWRIICDRSLETDQQTTTTSRQTSDVSYDPSILKALQHGTWMDEEGFKQACINVKKNLRHPTAFLRYMGSRLHAETGGRKVYAGKVSE